MARENRKSRNFEKRDIPLRVPGEKVSLSTSSPSKALFDEVKKQLESEKNDSSSSSISSTTNTSVGVSSRTPDTRGFTEKTIDIQPVSPTRDFQKVPSSLTREALPAGMFRGKSKQVYDCLWAISRGSIQPHRIFRCSRKQIMKGSGIGSMVAIDAALLHLEVIGLISKVSVIGAYEGNEYEIFTFEEIRATSISSISDTSTSSSSATSFTSPTQNLAQLDELEMRTSSTTQIEENKAGYSAVKTIIKTKEEKNDDEPAAAGEILKIQREIFVEKESAFSELNKALEEATKKLTGKGTTVADRARWKHVADILITQLEIIASRTPISNAPAILTEHLHRQLNSQRALEQMGLITPTEARAKKEPAKHGDATKESTIQNETTSEDTIPDLYLCPDCDGTTYWNPNGKGRQPGCPHPRLEEAREKARLEG